MTHRTNQNSVLFLATLGVYFGLLIVGGSTPQVFAHSATTRAFEISDEIEIRDDLDNKPDDERTPVHLSLQNYLEDVEMFIAALANLQKGGHFDPATGRFDIGQSTELPCVDANRAGSYTATQFLTGDDSIRKTLEWFSKRLTDGYSLADCRQNARLGRETHDSTFILNLKEDLFTVEVSVKKSSPENARLLSAELQDTYKKAEIPSAKLVLLRIYEHTTFRVENDQVFVVTRLARSDIEFLLANDAK